MKARIVTPGWDKVILYPNRQEAERDLAWLRTFGEADWTTASGSGSKTTPCGTAPRCHGDHDHDRRPAAHATAQHPQSAPAFFLQPR